MRTPKHSHDSIRQNEKIVKKSQKHDTNLQKNTTLYFQIGLIVCLLLTYVLFEMKFETTISNYGDLPPLVDPDYIDVPIIKPEEPTFDEPLLMKENKKTDNFKIIEDDFPIDPIKPKNADPINEDNPPLHPDGLSNLPKEPEEAPVPFAFIQDAPIYPGCERFKDNNKRKKCMSEKISKLIQRKFNTGIASEYGLSGVQKIDIGFKIDKTGHVTDIQTRSPHPKLDKEAKRVVQKIPEMIPGKQRDRNVDVIYNLPIIFKVED